MPSSQLEARLAKVREEIAKEDLDAAIITCWEDLYYLTSLRPIQYFIKSYDPMPLVVSADANRVPVFFPSMMFGMAVKLEHSHLKDVRPYEAPELWGLVSNLLSEWRVKRVGVESRYLPLYHAEAMLKHLPSLNLVDITEILEAARMVKSPEELSYLRKASEITDRTATAMLEHIRPGKTEMDVTRDIIRLAMEFGAEDVTFHPQVFSGKRGYLLNITSSETKKLERGEVVLLDFGVVYKGYKTDITRPYLLGSRSSTLTEIDRKVAKIVTDTIDYIHPGVKASEIHSFALKKFKDVGYEGHCRHYSGHGLGLAIEKPVLREYDSTEIRQNMVLAVEQGIYLPAFGIRYEDNLVVTESGIEDMNRIPMELIEIG